MLLMVAFTGYRLAAEVNRQHSEYVCIYTHTLRVLPIHFGRETVPSVIIHSNNEMSSEVILYKFTLRALMSTAVDILCFY